MDLILIFVLQVIFVSISTFRWIILMRGNYKMASVLSFFEVLINLTALSIVFSKLGNPLNMMVYALGYASGAWIGSRIEERLAYGFYICQIITKSPNDLATILRWHGLAVTAWPATGRSGPREVLLVVIRRNLTRRLYKLLDEHDPSAFVLAMEPRVFRGGFMAKNFAVVPAPSEDLGHATSGGDKKNH